MASPGERGLGPQRERERGAGESGGPALSSRSAAYWPGDLGVSQTPLRVGRSGEGPGDKNVPLTCLAPASWVTPDSEAPVPPDDPGGPEGRSAAEPCLGRMEGGGGQTAPRLRLAWFSKWGSAAPLTERRARRWLGERVAGGRYMEASSRVLCLGSLGLFFLLVRSWNILRGVSVYVAAGGMEAEPPRKQQRALGRVRARSTGPCPPPRPC